MTKSGNMTFRVEEELQVAFVAACKANDMSAAQVLRAAMRDYLSNNNQGSLPLTGKAKAKGK